MTEPPERRSDIVALAQQIFLLQAGRHGGLFGSPEIEPDVMMECYRLGARRALDAAEAFITESRKEKP